MVTKITNDNIDKCEGVLDDVLPLLKAELEVFAYTYLVFDEKNKTLKVRMEREGELVELKTFVNKVQRSFKIATRKPVDYLPLAKSYFDIKKRENDLLSSIEEQLDSIKKESDDVLSKIGDLKVSLTDEEIELYKESNLSLFEYKLKCLIIRAEKK